MCSKRWRTPSDPSLDAEADVCVHATAVVGAGRVARQDDLQAVRKLRVLHGYGKNRGTRRGPGAERPRKPSRAASRGPLRPPDAGATFMSSSSVANGWSYARWSPSFGVRPEPAQSAEGGELLPGGWSRPPSPDRLGAPDAGRGGRRHAARDLGPRRGDDSCRSRRGARGEPPGARGARSGGTLTRSTSRASCGGSRPAADGQRR